MRLQDAYYIGRGRTRRLSNKGFTLVEAVVSLLVFAVIVLIFAGSIVLAEKTARLNGQYAQAISLCQHKIDQLRAVGYGRLNYTELNDAGIIADYPTTSPYTFNNTSDEVENYLLNPVSTLTIEAVDAKTMRVTATITWRNSSNNSKTSTMSLTGLITNVE